MVAVLTANLALLLAACVWSEQTSLADLRLDPANTPMLVRVETYASIEKGRDMMGSPVPAAILERLDAAGITASANYRYFINTPDGASELNTRIDVYREAAMACAALRDRHMPAALAGTHKLDFAADGFVLPSHYLSFCQNKILVSIRAEPSHAGLNEFARIYATRIAKN